MVDMVSRLEVPAYIGFATANGIGSGVKARAIFRAQREDSTGKIACRKNRQTLAAITQILAVCGYGHHA